MTKTPLRLTVALLALPLLTPTFMQAATPAKSAPAQDVPVTSVIDPQRLSSRPGRMAPMSRSCRSCAPRCPRTHP